MNMLNILKEKLDQQGQLQQNSQSRIDSLFLRVQDIKFKMQNINNHQLTINSNLIIQLRPELLNIILAFLDYSQFLQFRLVCQNTNNKILYLLSQRINQSQQQIQSKQIQINEIQQNYTELDEIPDLIFFQYLDAFDSIKKLQMNIYEIKSIHRPVQIIERVLNLLVILLKEKHNESDNWLEILRLINDCRFLEYLLNFDIQSISEEKLILLQPIYNIDEKIVSSSSSFAYDIYKYILAIVKFREQPKYKFICQIGQLNKDIIKLQKYIEKQKKILGQAQ